MRLLVVDCSRAGIDDTAEAVTKAFGCNYEEAARHVG
jgi:hypothetical protein